MNFDNIFGHEAVATIHAPGRVNLIGEHTDYNQGFALPMPIPFYTTVAVGENETQFEVYSTRFKEFHTFDLQTVTPTGWMNYVVGCLKELAKNGFVLPGAQVFIDSTVPVGAGLSSSAALCVGLLKAFRVLGKFDFDDKRLVHFAQQVEWNYAGVQCGLLDQMAICFSKPAHALCLDMRYLISDNIPISNEASFVIVDSQVERNLADGVYNERRAACERAATELKVTSLREISVNDLPKVELLSEELKKRARHVVTENHRVLLAAMALRESRFADFGQLMNASHVSLKNDFEVSHPKLDVMVEQAQKFGALGARMTGAGFGGCMVALLSPGEKQRWCGQMQQAFPDTKILNF